MSLSDLLDAVVTKSWISKNPLSSEKMSFVLTTSRGNKARVDGKATIYLKSEEQELPVAVAKVALSTNSKFVEHHFRQLSILQKLGISDFEIPVPLGTIDTIANKYYLESYIDVETPMRNEKITLKEIHRAFDLLIDFHYHTISPPDPENLREILDDYFQLLESARCLRSTSICEKVRLIKKNLYDFVDRCPTVVMHGDYHLGQILSTKNGKAVIMDWEHSRIRGFPGVDLFELIYTANIFIPSVPDLQKIISHQLDSSSEDSEEITSIFMKYIFNYFEKIGLLREDIVLCVKLFCVFTLVRTIELRGDILKIDGILERIALAEDLL